MSAAGSVVVASRLCLDDLDLPGRELTRAQDLEAVTPRGNARPGGPRHARRRDPHGLVVVMQQLSPAERLVFILHDIFGFCSTRRPDRRPNAAGVLQAADLDSTSSQTPAGASSFAHPTRNASSNGSSPPVPVTTSTRLLELLDPDVVGEVDLGLTDFRPLQVGRDLVAGNLLRFFGTRSGIALVPHPLDGKAGALAFKAHRLFALITFKTGNGRITDIHAIADPHKLAIASLQFRPES
jgi:RNA polymerase sigma-70 factor (ECF subfamily)